jgi:hypothetical protein
MDMSDCTSLVASVVNLDHSQIVSIGDVSIVAEYPSGLTWDEITSPLLPEFALPVDELFLR